VAARAAAPASARLPCGPGDAGEGLRAPLINAERRGDPGKRRKARGGAVVVVVETMQAAGLPCSFLGWRQFSAR